MNRSERGKRKKIRGEQEIMKERAIDRAIERKRERDREIERKGKRYRVIVRDRGNPAMNESGRRETIF